MPLIDEAVVEAVKALGGISAIAISHPHYYSSMVEWSRAFGGVPIYLHAADRQWVMRPDPAIVFWDGETQAAGRRADADPLRRPLRGRYGPALGGRRRRKGALLTGDIIQVVPDRKHVSFMYSYPNYIPLPASADRADHRGRRAVRVRPDLRGILGHGDRAGRQGGGQRRPNGT